MEQFIQCVPEELAVWIKEKKPTSVRQAAELADAYTLARNGDKKTLMRKANGPKAAAQQPRANRTPRLLERQERGAHSAWPKKRNTVLPLQRCGPYDGSLFAKKGVGGSTSKGAIWRIMWRSGVEYQESQVPPTREYRRESRTDADRHRM